MGGIRREKETYTTQTVVLVVILGLLDHVPPHDIRIAMLIFFVVDKVNLFEQLLLVILELANHFLFLFFFALLLVEEVR